MLFNMPLRFFLPLLVFALPTSLRAQDLDPVKVRQAMDRGVRFLKNRQDANGSWHKIHGYERCGSTALAVLAMMSCGVPKNDPAIQKAMTYLRLFPGDEAGQNYSLSLQTMAFCLVEPEQDRELIRANVKLLEKRQVRGNSVHAGGWHYTEGILSDLSNSQFSILALYEAERVGVNAQRETWSRAFRYWSKTQNTQGSQNGSWGYTPTENGSNYVRGSMTCAGIASLIVTSGVLGSGGALVRGDRIDCFQPNRGEAAEQIQKGLAWLGRHFSVSQNPAFGGYLYYYLYALERVGRMTNHRFIADHDWYREGADKLLQLQDDIDGGWRNISEPDIVATSFALLFLSKGRRPVLMSKMQFGEGNFWNVHPNDANNLTLYAEKQWKQEMTWQMVDLDRATPDHLLQSPVLYFSGNRSPLQADDAKTARTAAKLRQYIDQGGFIMAESQSNDKTGPQGFDSGFRELMKLVFPEPGYELQLLERSHPIWAAEVRIDPEMVRPIEGINFGCRTSVVYVPPFTNANTKQAEPSLSCLWEVAPVFLRERSYPAPVQKQIDAGLGIGMNILAYATERELKFKDEIAEAASQQSVETGQRRGKVFLSFLDPGGAMNPAPHAASNLLLALEAGHGVSVETKTDTITGLEEDMYEHPILFMHGRSEFSLSPEQRENLRNHLLRGGFLFVNAICSSAEFSNSFQKEVRAIFPDSSMEAIPIDDPLFQDIYGGYNISAQKTLEMRMPERAPGRPLVSRSQHVAPRLFGIRHNDRLILVFSPDDVSCALEKASSMECRGYTNASAIQLATNVLLYALEHW